MSRYVSCGPHKSRIKEPIMNPSVRENLSNFLQHYAEMNRQFESLFGYSLFITHGTLLGFVRDGGPIAHDDYDFDVGYLSSCSSVDSVRREYINILESLFKSGQNISIIRRDGTSRRSYFHWYGHDGIHIDVFPTWYEKGRIWSPFKLGSRCSAEAVKPLRQKYIQGQSVFFPNQPEILLAAIYGEDWQIPDPNHKLSCNEGEKGILHLEKLKISKQHIRRLLKYRARQSGGRWELECYQKREKNLRRLARKERSNKMLQKSLNVYWGMRSKIPFKAQLRRLCGK